MKMKINETKTSEKITFTIDGKEVTKEEFEQFILCKCLVNRIRKVKGEDHESL